MATYHFTAKAGSKDSGACASLHAEYILRIGKYEYKKDDLENEGYGNLPVWALNSPMEFWRASDTYEATRRTVYREHELALPNEASPQQRQAIIDTWCAEHYKGHSYLYAIHLKDNNPHAHIMFCDRRLDEVQRNPELFFKRANKKNPEKGGCEKSARWNGKDRDQHLFVLRKSWAEIQNQFYQSIGHEVRVDHRSLRSQQKEAHDKASFYENSARDDLANVERIKAALLDREPDRRVNHRRYRIAERDGELVDLQEYRRANREAAAAKAELQSAKLERTALYKKQQDNHAARNAAWQAENRRRSTYRSNRQTIRTTGRIASQLLPKPLGMVIELAADIVLVLAKINDWRQAHHYKSQVEQLKSTLNRIKAERDALSSQIKAKSQPIHAPATSTSSAASVPKPIAEPQPVSLPKEEPRIQQDPVVTPVVEQLKPVQGVNRAASSSSSDKVALSQQQPVVNAEPAPVETVAISQSPTPPAVKIDYKKSLNDIQAAIAKLQQLYLPTAEDIEADTKHRFPQLEVLRQAVSDSKAKVKPFNAEVANWRKIGEEHGWDAVYTSYSWFPAHKEWQKQGDALKERGKKLTEEHRQAEYNLSRVMDQVRFYGNQALKQLAQERLEADPRFIKLNAIQAKIRSKIKEQDQDNSSKKGRGGRR